jgi:hypothetical protein
MSQENQDVTRKDLEQHPELTPILETDSHGRVICIGWTSPIYTFSLESMENINE